MVIGWSNTGIQPSSSLKTIRKKYLFFSVIEETFSNTEKQFFSIIICKIIFNVLNLKDITVYACIWCD